ncbi:hypothetical protein FQN49_001518 [Arthroderma sp. PD_2]|nr:hypothetical protein FQN49_001518 [Arthroderma sp. PD_2]
MEISSETWEGLKETIRQLYVEQNLSISGLMQVMESQHYFRASRKQYLSRIVRWGFNRNVKAEAMIRVALIREKRRRLYGKPTVFAYNGREVDERKIERFIRDRFGKGQLDRVNFDNVSTPAGITYGTPGDIVDVDDDDDATLLPDPMDHEPSDMAEMPRAILWILGAARPLRYEELAIACAIMEDKRLSDYIPVISTSWTLGAFQTDENNFIEQTSKAPEIIAQLIPTDDPDNLILETILKGMTQNNYLGYIFKGQQLSDRFETEPSEFMQYQIWWTFLQYATIYWPSHLCNISNPLTLGAEAALSQLVSQPMCLTWIEALAVFTGKDFRVSLSRVLHMILSYCSSDGHSLLRPETISLLRIWARSCQHLLRDWERTISKWPGEVHYIEPIFLPNDSLFLKKRNIIPQWTLSDYRPLDPNIMKTHFGEICNSSQLCEVDDSARLIYVTSRNRGSHFRAASGGVSEPVSRHWRILCISIDTGLRVAEYDGESLFEDRDREWDAKSVDAQLALSPDGRYLVYEECVDYAEENGKIRTFTYYWKLQPTMAADGDLFGEKIPICQGEQSSSPGYRSETLKFFIDNINLLHTCGIYNVETQVKVKPQYPIDSLHDIRSVRVSADCTMTVLTGVSNDSPSEDLEIWKYSVFRTPAEMHQVHRGVTDILALSRSGRFLAFMQNSLGEFGAQSLVVLDTKSWYKHELYSYRLDRRRAAWDLPKKKYHVPPAYVSKVFFGNSEAEPTLLVVKPRSSEGRIWRLTVEGWRNIGLIQLDRTCRPLKFNKDDTMVIGICSDGMFSADVRGLQSPIRNTEKAVFREENEFALTHWEGSSFLYINTERNNGEYYQIGGWLWRLGGQTHTCEKFDFLSPAGLRSMKDIRIPFLGAFIYITLKGRLGQFSSRVNFKGNRMYATDDIQRYDHIAREMTCVSSGGRYILAASFWRPMKEIGWAEVAKSHRLQVFENGETSCLWTFVLQCEHAGGTISRDIDPSLEVEAFFHPSLPVLAWTYPQPHFGFWLSDLQAGSKPIFDDVYSACCSLSFSQCSRYLIVLYKGYSANYITNKGSKMGVLIFDLREGLKYDFSWAEEEMKYQGAYAICHGDHVFVVGFNADSCLVAIKLSIYSDGKPGHRYLMAFPMSQAHLCKVQWCGITEGLLKILIVDRLGRRRPDGAHSIIITGCYVASIWGDARFKIDTCQFNGPKIEMVDLTCHLRAPPPRNQQPETSMEAEEPETALKCCGGLHG